MHVPQMTMRGWLSRNLDYMGVLVEELVPCMGRPGLRLLALRGARVDTLTQPGLEDAAT